MYDYGNRQFHMDIPRDVELIINVLEKAGYEAYAVGGCVRDAILGRKPDDWDVTTSALPQDVKRLFRRTVDTGIKHGTVTVLIKSTGYEVTTYRVDGNYTDGRRPDSVRFTSNLLEDLKRRDFTINAMAYNPKTGLVDIFGGHDDLRNKIIRCVGDAKERFGEDALRMLRAVRFAAQLGFNIEDNTMAAIKELAPSIANISEERIREELEKLIISDNPGMIRIAYELGITNIIMPKFDIMMATPQNTIYHIYSVGEHAIHVMEGVRADRILRWTALLHDIGKPKCRTVNSKGQDSFKEHAVVGAPMAREILKSLKADNKTVNIVSKLVECHMDNPVRKEKSMTAMRRSIHKIGKDLYPMFLEIRRADILAKSRIKVDEAMEELTFMEEAYDRIIKAGDCIDIKDMNISGKDLIAMGIGPGREIGEILEYLFDEVLKNPALNEKETLIEMAKNYKTKTVF